jgi:hypothetical protein
MRADSPAGAWSCWIAGALLFQKLELSLVPMLDG